MKLRPVHVSPILIVAALTVAYARGQGPASCGFHLDVRCNLTSTHSAVADMPNAPGTFTGMPHGPGGGVFAQGNPYVAYTTPGALMVMTVNCPALASGPAPIGPGSCLTIMWSAPGSITPILTGPPFIPTCVPGTPTIVGVLPIGGTVVDSCGLLGPTPPFGFIDGGSGRFTFTGAYPVGGPPEVTFQAALITPGGAIGLTNAVTVVAGLNNPYEGIVGPVGCTAFPMNDGQFIGPPLVGPSPSFYGFPIPFGADMDTNGFVDFISGVGPGVAGGCDPVGTAGDFGCPPATPQARPRIDVNHMDFDFGIPLAAPFAPQMTLEYRASGSPFWPGAMILRWKNAPPATLAAGSSFLSTANFVIEIDEAYRIVIVRQSTPTGTAGQCGIGPGVAGQGFGGPPPGGLIACSLGPAGFAFMTMYGIPGGFVNAPNAATFMNDTSYSSAVGNCAIVFTPLPTGPPPNAYQMNVY